MRKLLILSLSFLCLAAPLHAADEDVELALEPPDEGGESQLKEQLEQTDAELREPAVEGEESGEGIARNKDNDAEIPKIGDEHYESNSGTEQQRLLRYHRNLLADRETIAASGEEDPPHQFHVALGAHFGISTPAQTQGNVDFQVTVSRHFTLGAYVNGSNDSILGAFAVNYYSRRPYEGIWVQVGAGFESFTTNPNIFNDATISSTTPIVLDVGWRWLGLRNNLTFAFGAGINGYFFVPNPIVVFNAKLQLGLAWNIWPH